MATNYPTGLDNFPINRSDSTPTATTHAADHDNENDAINKIEAELGINPSGIFPTLAAYLQDLSNRITSIDFSGVLLSWQPPSVTQVDWDPKTVTISGAGNKSITRVGGDPLDLKLICSSQVTDGEIIISGWRHVEAIGGKSVYTIPRDANEHRGISFRANTGIMHLEGWEFTATNNALLDTIVLKDFGGPNSRLQIQKCRFGPCINDTGGHHSDGFQAQMNPQLNVLAFDFCTFVGDEAQIGPAGNSHGLFITNDDVLSSPGSYINQAYVRRCNFRGYQHAIWQQTVSDVTLGAPPINLGVNSNVGDVFITNNQGAPFGYDIYPQADGHIGTQWQTLPRKAILAGDGNSLTFSPECNISGKIMKGPPPGGDYVVAGAVGVGYVSPGYVGGTPPPAGGVFPTTGILDSFSGTLSNWTIPSLGESGVLSIISGEFGNVSGTWAGAIRTGTYGPNTEVYCTIATPGTSGQRIILLLRGSGSGATYNAYTMEVDCLGGSWDLYRVSAGVGTWLASSTQLVAAGDKIGMDVVGSKLTIYHKPAAGSWVQKMTYTDLTPISTAGWVGMKTLGAVYRSDDFGGGTVIP